MGLVAFHGKKDIKEFFLKRIRHHIENDNLVRGKGWDGFKGCGVGCTLEAYDHSRYPIELGIPEWLAKVEDTLFEGMDLEKSKTWPEVFLAAINVGSDLEKVKVPFLVMILESNISTFNACEFDRENNPKVVESIELTEKATEQMIAALRSGDQKLISAARSAAESAASAAWSAAESAASAARSAASAAESAASAAESAAWSTAWSAESAAWSAAESAASAAESAASAAWSAAWSTAWSAESAAYDYYADELINLLKEQR